MDLNFSNQIIRNDDVNISVNVTGQGEPLLLIHGYPETHLGWHKLVPELAKKYTVICPDVRGNGASDKPAGVEDHSNYSKRALGARLGSVAAVHPEVLAAFEDNLQNPEVIHAACEDHRAGAGIDLEHDTADSDKKIQCPLLVVWGSGGPEAQLYDTLAIWQGKADNVRGVALECGRYPAQEKPKELLAALDAFL